MPPLEATYDYTAPIGEAGQFHNYYGPARQAAYFAQTFASLIATSSYQADLAKGTSAGCRVTPRQSPNGTVVFVDDFTQGKPGIDPTADVTTKVAVTGMGNSLAEAIWSFIRTVFGPCSSTCLGHRQRNWNRFQPTFFYVIRWEGNYGSATANPMSMER